MTDFYSEVPNYTMVNVLFALTSHHDVFYDDGAKTGLFFVEALHPFHTFHKANANITFVSETGTFGWDEHSLSADFLQGDDRKTYEDKDSDFMKAIGNVKKASDLSPEDYDVFFAAGGHGCLFDFPKATALHLLASKIWAKGGVVSAVCHGPLIFNNMKAQDGEALIKGKKITGFADQGEVIMQLDQKMKAQGLKTPKDVAVAEGANWVEPADPWGLFVVTDGKLVTGVNPASASETAEKALAAL